MLKSKKGRKKEEKCITSFDICLSSDTRAFAVFSMPRVMSTGLAPAATTCQICPEMRPNCDNKQKQTKPNQTKQPLVYNSVQGTNLP